MIELSQNITDYILNHFGYEYLVNYKSYFDGEYKPYMRVSRLCDENTLLNRLSQYGITAKKIENVPNCFQFLTGEKLAGKTLEFINGNYYLQSLSSMIPPLVLNPSSSDRVLDLCAAPGSKTTQLAEYMHGKGTLIANEISMDRLKSLVFNIDKMNIANIGIIRGKGELLGAKFSGYFDKVLVDAPCSALGITQKKGEVSNWWNANKLSNFSDLQFRLLISAIKLCKVGGEIVYSTCTLSFEENELVINKILEKYPVELMDIELPVKSRNAFTKFEEEELNATISKAQRIVPWEINSEGFFVAKFKKIDATDKSFYSSAPSKDTELISAVSSKIKNQLNEFSEYFGVDPKVLKNYNYLLRSHDIYFIDSGWNCFDLDSFLRIGSKLGSIEKRGYIQLHTLGAKILAPYITQNIIELRDKKELEIYLKGGTIKKDFNAFGQQVIKYRGEVIGTAVISQEGLKSQFPRAFRTQEIVLPS